MEIAPLSQEFINPDAVYRPRPQVVLTAENLPKPQTEGLPQFIMYGGIQLHVQPVLDTQGVRIQYFQDMATGNLIKASDPNVKIVPLKSQQKKAS